MERIVLKKSILESIKDSGLLFGQIADALNISPASLPRLIYSNDEKLTQASVIRLIKEHTGIEDDSMILEEEPDNNNNTLSPIMQEK